MTRSELILFCKMISCFNVITFHNRERVIVIFRTRIFDLSGKGITPIHGKILDISHAEDKENGNGLISYAKNYVKPRLERADDGNRTRDLRTTNATHYRLCYISLQTIFHDCRKLLYQIECGLSMNF